MRHIFGFWRYAPNQKKYARRGGPDAPFWRKCAKSGDTECLSNQIRPELDLLEEVSGIKRPVIVCWVSEKTIFPFRKAVDSPFSPNLNLRMKLIYPASQEGNRKKLMLRLNFLDFFALPHISVLSIFYRKAIFIWSFSISLFLANQSVDA